MLGGGGFPNSKVIGGYDFGDSDSNPMDCNGHGTAVAGISAGTLASGPGDYIGGVAHNARLYALKIVSGCAGSASISNIAASWDWAVTHKNDDTNNPILIINTSFGGLNYSSPCDASEPTYAAAADNLVANGITLFASSGNNANDNGIGRPACVNSAIAVGAVYDANVGSKSFTVCTDPTTAADQVTCYSNSDTFLDLLAPSHDAYTTAVGGGYTATFGGTSAASPYSAGAGALLQHYAKSTTGSYYTPAQLKAKLVDNGDPITDPRNGITKPRVNVGNAIEPAPIWSYCIKDVLYSTEYWINLEYSTRLVRGQALFPSSNFPAPITGTHRLNPGQLLFSVDYLLEGGLRFYRINPGTFAAETWGILDSDGSYYDGPRAATIEFCPTEAAESAMGESGAAK
jgi:subtilisin family serine protease